MYYLVSVKTKHGLMHVAVSNPVEAHSKATELTGVAGAVVTILDHQGNKIALDTLAKMIETNTAPIGFRERKFTYDL